MNQTSKEERIRRYKYAQSVGWDTKKMAAEFGVSWVSAWEFKKRYREMTLSELESYKPTYKPRGVCVRDLGVDMGLPSGTVWDKSNYQGGGLFGIDEFKSIPKVKEWRELIAHTVQEWDAVRKGMRFKSKHNGNSVFFPADGLLECGAVRQVGKMGFYWAVEGSIYYAVRMSESGVKITSYSTETLMSCRCVY